MSGYNQYKEIEAYNDKIATSATEVWIEGKHFSLSREGGYKAGRIYPNAYQEMWQRDDALYRIENGLAVLLVIGIVICFIWYMMKPHEIQR